MRDEIVKLGGIARTDRDATEIVHTEDYRVMLQESMKTESFAARTYKEFLARPGVLPAAITGPAVPVWEYWKKRALPNGYALL